MLGGGEDAVPPLLADDRVEVRRRPRSGPPSTRRTGRWARSWPCWESRRCSRGSPCRDALTRLPHAASSPLALAIRTAQGDAALGAPRVAVSIPEPALATAALERCADPDPRVRAGAARVLGGIGGESTVASLEAMLDDDDARARAAAAASLGQLRHWPVAVSLQRCLRDPSWDVRRAAALALRGLGPVGEVLLRRALRDEDRFARDIATLALDLPEAVVSA